jgi:hypothetical protein
MAQMVYVDGLATPGNFTTSGSANTEVGAIDFLAAATGQSVNMLALSCGGKSSGLTTLTAIALRVRKYGTASTGGTGSSIVAVDPAMQAATHTSNTGQTLGSTPTYLMSVIFGAAGPGGWVAPNPDAMPRLKAASTTASLDIVSTTGGTSLPFELTAQIVEL